MANGEALIGNAKGNPVGNSNLLDNPVETFRWDYVVMDKCSSVEQTDKFIDNLENMGCPEIIIKEAIKTFYALQK